VTVLLIYTHKITPRFGYVAKHIFTRILGIQVAFTTRIEDFIGHKGPKITYTRQPLQNEFFIRNHELLFRVGVDPVSVQMGDWDGIPAFFKTGDRSNIPFDVFAASFYLISRYEEYLPHLRDEHGRFPPSESLAYQQGFLHLPLVEMWAYKLLSVLQERFPEIQANPQPYKFQPVIDVTTSHAYAHRGLFRSLGGLILDLSQFQFKKVWERIKVNFQLMTDPYDNFMRLIDLHKTYPVEVRFFFQFASYSTYDKNISIHNQTFQALIKSVGDYAPIGLSASYSAFNNPDLLKQEKNNLSEVIHRSVDTCRMRFNRVDIPQTYRDLALAEFQEDFSLGYTHQIGFRASTCMPFFFYDLALESIQPVRIIPFAIHDYALLNFPNNSAILEAFSRIYESIKDVNGNFCCVFSNELLGGASALTGMDHYEHILKNYHA
jgi:hypothetical protein